MAVPGFISPHVWNGQMLWDGGMSWDGLCPVGIPLSKIIGARPEDVIGCHVGVRQLPGFKNTLKKSWEQILRLGSSFTEEEKDPHRWESQGVIIVHPELNKFGSLKFSLTADEKWDAVISSFLSTARTLAARGLIGAEKLQEMETLASNRQAFISDCNETGE
jgi:predicted acylesterase/phospholipase RssA